MIPVKFFKATMALLLCALTFAVVADPVTHTYDAQNRLIRSEYDDGSGIEYAYDAAGNRVGQKAINRPAAKPDLVVTSVNSQANGTAGGTMLVLVNLMNQGGQDAGEFWVVFYLSKDKTLSVNEDIYLKWGCEYTSLAAGASSKCAAENTPIPEAVEPGVYYVGAYVDAFATVAESNEGNNLLVAEKPITIAASSGATALLTVEKIGNGGGVVTGVGIDCGSDCSESYPKGTAVSLTATAAAGSVFGGWSESCSGTGTCSLTMDASKKVVATFNVAPANPYPLTVTKSANGLVMSTPSGIVCGGPHKQCKGNFSTVTLTATPKSGYYLKKWVGCPVPADDTCTLTLGKKTTVNAVFAKLPKYALKIVKTPNGEITSDPAGLKCKATAKTCSAKFVSGTRVSLNPIPQAGYSFGGWDGACSGTGACEVIMDGKKVLGARFE